MNYTCILINNRPEINKTGESLKINNLSLINQLKKIFNNIK